MPMLTLRLLDGADRGRVYENLEPPITIGREEGNTIQLNDERVSRYHVKIQEDNEKLVLTDLESTNGTRVNGEDIQLCILRFGDLLTIGRSVLVFGSREEIAERLANLRKNGTPKNPTVDEKSELLEGENQGDPLDYELNWSDDADLQATLHLLEPPELPERLSPAQAAQLSELLEYLHIRVRNVLHSAHTNEDEEMVELEVRPWQDLIDFQARVGGYLRLISDPGKE
ncbi:MAG: FHA domain-containing protein [Planctomycetaceae bacterium]|nr:FHA domain-containing protein [Planctomycetaceae bacterium]MBP60903.1 FHA domain-containing protein [Planctomycetaceae bacterium]